MDAATFATTFIALWSAHEIADHWLQTHPQAMTKGERSWRGRFACARHVTTLTLTQAVFLVAAVALFDLSTAPVWATLGLTVNAVTHYWCDRRTTLAWLARVLSPVIPGRADFHALGDGRAAPCGTGAYALDQRFHLLFVVIAAGIATIGA